MTTIVRRRGSLSERRFIDGYHDSLRTRLARWAEDPRTSIAQIRSALDEVIENQPRPEWDAFALKVEYLDLMRRLGHRLSPSPEQMPSISNYRLGELRMPTEVVAPLYAVKRHLRCEPERSRRVIQHVFANWLANVESPDPTRKMPAVRARFQIGNRATGVFLYHVSPHSPANAHVLSPQELAGWIVRTEDAGTALADGLWPSLRQAEHRGHRELVVLLARELYHREHGALPETDDLLVGTFLKTLPDDGSDDLDDGTIQTIEDSYLYDAMQSE
jgi:hypothetical protein